MRHRKANPKLGRTTAHRKAMIRNMVTSLLREERVETTVPKAKEARRIAERVITIAKGGSLHHRRLAARVVHDKGVLKRLFEVVAPRYATRPGGYTRILKTGYRAGDNAPLSILELLDSDRAVTEPTTDEKTKGKKREGAAKTDKAPRAEKAPREKRPSKKDTKAGLSKGAKKPIERTQKKTAVRKTAKGN
jgi:large subunit ribosomal protein L17